MTLRTVVTSRGSSGSRCMVPEAPDTKTRLQVSAHVRQKKELIPSGSQFIGVDLLPTAFDILLSGK